MVSAERPRESDYEQEQITATLGLYVHKLDESDRERAGAQKVPLIEKITTDRRKTSGRISCHSAEKVHGPGRQ
jgi:hypothetical protein